MGQAAATTKNNRDELSFDQVSIKSINDENKESTTLIWFDPNIASYEDIDKTKEKLRHINDFVVFMFDLEECITFIQSIEKEKIFLITSGEKAPEILSRIMSLSQLDSSFIFCTKKEQYEYLLKEYSKLIGIYDNLDSLCRSIQEQLDLFNKQIQTFSFFDHHETLAKDLSKESATFLWYQLLNDVIIRLPRNPQAKQQMIQLCKEYYRGNRKELALIREFEQSYQSKDAIVWYSKQCFIYKLVNKALMTKDIDLLYRFQFYISDLSENLQREYEKFLSSDEEIINVYRGVKLDKEEFNRLKNNEEKLISFNGYLSTSRNKSLALLFAMTPSNRMDVIPVVFHIKCDIERMKKVIAFADTKEFSTYAKEEEEVVFGLSACFQIESIEEKESLQTIKMSLSNEGKKITRDYLKLMKEETEELSSSIIFGRLLCNMGEYDKSEKYFEQLLNESKDEDPAWLEYNIGRVLYFKKDWNEARQYYDRAYDRMMKSKPERVKNSAWVLNNIGALLATQGKYTEALEYHRRAFQIRKKYYSSDHVDIASSLHNMGLIFFRQGKYNEALDCHERALLIRMKLYSSGHLDVANSLINMGRIFYKKKQYDQVLSCYQRALKIRQEMYPLGHIDIATSLNNIGLVLANQGKFNEANDYYQKALEIQKQLYSSGHVNMATVLNNIGACYGNQNKRKNALECYQRSMTIYEKFVPINHPNRQMTERNINRLSGGK